MVLSEDEIKKVSSRVFSSISEQAGLSILAVKTILILLINDSK
jgi:hypothetical protein